MRTYDKSSKRSAAPANPNKGVMMTEVLIASLVLMAVLSVLTQLFIRGGRLQMDNRRYQVALEELSNQMDRLTSLEEDARRRALESLACSEASQIALGSPELTATRLDDADGRRLVLTLAWKHFGVRKPVTLVGWLAPADMTTSDRPVEGPLP